MSKTILIVMQFFFAFQAVKAEEPSKVPALNSQQEIQYNDIAKGLRCPTCQGLSILESDAPFSNQIKDIVKEKVAQGMSAREIEAFFIDRYGAWILREPPKQGFNMLAWVIPVSLMLLGPLLLWLMIWRRQVPASNSINIRTDAEIIAEMESALKQLKRGA